MPRAHRKTRSVFRAACKREAFAAARNGSAVSVDLLLYAQEDGEGQALGACRGDRRVFTSEASEGS